MVGYDVIVYVTWAAKWHHSTFFFKFVSCTVIWYKNIPLKPQWKIWMVNQKYANLPFVSISSSCRKIAQLKTFLRYNISHNCLNSLSYIVSNNFCSNKIKILYFCYTHELFRIHPKIYSHGLVFLIWDAGRFYTRSSMLIPQHQKNRRIVHVPLI